MAADRDTLDILRVYVDGVVVASEDIGSFAFHDSTDGLSIGRLNTSSGFRRFLNGWLDALRVTKGVARYGGNFNPPQGPYSAFKALGVARLGRPAVSSGWHCRQCPRRLSDTLSRDLNANPLGIGRHVSGIADPFNGHIDEFRISHVQRSDGWIETTWNNISDPGAFAAAGAEEQEGGGGEPPPLAGAGVVVCLMA